MGQGHCKTSYDEKPAPGRRPGGPGILEASEDLGLCGIRRPCGIEDRGSTFEDPGSKFKDREGKVRDPGLKFKEQGFPTAFRSFGASSVLAATCQGPPRDSGQNATQELSGEPAAAQSQGGWREGLNCAKLEVQRCMVRSECVHTHIYI